MVNCFFSSFFFVFCCCCWFWLWCVVFNDDSQHRSYKKSLKQLPKSKRAATNNEGEAETSAVSQQVLAPNEALTASDALLSNEHVPRDQAVNRLVDVRHAFLLFLFVHSCCCCVFNRRYMYEQSNDKSFRDIDRNILMQTLITLTIATKNSTKRFVNWKKMIRFSVFFLKFCFVLVSFFFFIIARHFDQYTTEIKQSLERGTAI